MYWIVNIDLAGIFRGYGVATIWWPYLQDTIFNNRYFSRALQRQIQIQAKIILVGKGIIIAIGVIQTQTDW